MRNLCRCLVVLLCGLAMTVLGCRSEIGEVTIEMVPDNGCVPLTVALMGKAETGAGISGAFSWRIGKAVQLHGPHVAYTFETPGAYDISLTVVGETQTKTQVTTLQVGEAAHPHLPGLYRQQDCVYQAMQEVEEKKRVKRLGKTSLQDLQQRILGRDLSTLELVSHPLWRREHTHTVYTVDRHRFVEISLERFQALGVVAVGEDVGEVSLFRILPSPEPMQGQQDQVVTRVVDSWGLDNVTPERLTLTRTPLADNVVRYVPDEQLTAGLYVMHVQRQDNATRAISPVAIAASHQ